MSHDNDTKAAAEFLWDQVSHLTLDHVTDIKQGALKGIIVTLIGENGVVTTRVGSDGSLSRENMVEVMASASRLVISSTDK